MPIYPNMEALIGKTPMLALSRLGERLALPAQLFAKLEACNPGGSAKDRVALAMLDDAEARGLLAPGGTVIEPTSGNTGIGLCAVAAARGYRAVIVMPDSMSIERRRLMAAYGAEVVLTPGALGMRGAIARAEELAAAIQSGGEIYGRSAREIAEAATIAEMAEAEAWKILYTNKLKYIFSTTHAT